MALTLRALGGLTTRQIAEAYLVPEATMAQGISRAKRTVSGVSLDEPASPVTVLRVLYLVFNAGYSGDVDLSAGAIRLARRLHAVTGHQDGRAAGAHAAAPRPATGTHAAGRFPGAPRRAGPIPVGHRARGRGRHDPPVGARPRPAPPTCTPRRLAGPPTCRSAITSPARQHGSVRPFDKRGAPSKNAQSDLFSTPPCRAISNASREPWFRALVSVATSAHNDRGSSA